MFCMSSGDVFHWQPRFMGSTESTHLDSGFFLTVHFPTGYHFKLPKVALIYLQQELAIQILAAM